MIENVNQANIFANVIEWRTKFPNQNIDNRNWNLKINWFPSLSFYHHRNGFITTKLCLSPRFPRDAEFHLIVFGTQVRYKCYHIHGVYGGWKEEQQKRQLKHSMHLN